MPTKKLPSPERRCQMKRKDSKECRAALSARNQLNATGRQRELSVRGILAD